MSDFQKEMNRAVDGVVAQITDLARRAAMTTLETSFSARDGRRAAVASAPTDGNVWRPRGGRGAKRTAEDIDALADKFVAFVKAQPGLRVEQINKELGTTTKDLASCASTGSGENPSGRIMLCRSPLPRGAGRTGISAR